VPEATTITKQRYTLADLLEMPPEDEQIYEILGGELVVFSSPNEPHAAAVMGLIYFLGEAQRAGYGRVRTAPRAVAFDYAEHELASEDVTHPDVMFVREERRDIMGFRCVEGTPDLVIEVLSPTTRDRDQPDGQKWAIYERYGVPYYWIVDVVVRTITQYAWHDGRFGEPVVLRPGDTLGCPLFPGITCNVDDIFASNL
jgi:Uma2 family endonuclease